MNIFDIDKEIETIYADKVDPETGEITVEGSQRLIELSMEKDRKIDNVAKFYKNISAENEALRAERKKIDDRIKRNEKRLESCEGYLDYALQGETRNDVSYQIKYTKSTTTEVDPDFMEWASKNRKDLIRQKPAPDPEPDKTAIAKALKNGDEIEHAWREEHFKIKIY